MLSRREPMSRACHLASITLVLPPSTWINHFRFVLSQLLSTLGDYTRYFLRLYIIKSKISKFIMTWAIIIYNSYMYCWSKLIIIHLEQNPKRLNLVKRVRSILRSIKCLEICETALFARKVALLAYTLHAHAFIHVWP